MAEHPIIHELQAKLDDAEWLQDEDREHLEEMLRQVTEMCEAMERREDFTEEFKEEERGRIAELWTNYFNACHNVEEKAGELLEKQADMADAMRNLCMTTLRIMHGARKAIKEGEFTGTWEQREAALQSIEEMEEMRDEYLKRLSAEDIRQLQDEGVLD